MRLQTKMFVILGAFALTLWGGASWAVQHTLEQNFIHLASQALYETQQSVRAMQGEHIKRMRQASSLVMNSPELRALIAEHNYEFSPDNLASLEERLDTLTRMLNAGFVCVLDDRGNAIAQSRGSPWHDVPALQQYLSKTIEAKALVRGLFAGGEKPSGASNQSRGNYGLWVVDGHLLQTVGVPLIFENDDEGASHAGALPEGALLVATSINDQQADELAESHGCELTFLTGGKVVASSILSRASRAQLPGLANASFGAVAFIGNTEYRLSTEKLFDPCSGHEVGTILIQSNQTDAQAVRARVNQTLRVILCGGLLLVAIGSYLISRAMTRPVADLLIGVRRVAGGDLTLRLPARRQDELGALAGAFNDMVIQLHARRELELQIEESRAASRAKSQFLANMSHEIRTPLNGVIGMADLLLGTKLSDRQHRYAALVKSSAEVLTTLINDALDFAKIESGKMELESIDFDLHTLVEEVVEVFAPRAIKKGLGIACDISGDVILTARGDPNRLRQVLLNLLNNAIKFTAAGEIVVSVAPDPSAVSMIKISVTDTGVGIPADRLDRLFRAFSQVDASTTRRFGGTGLGLAISKQLVELMGGGIGVESRDGRGSTFWFTVKLGAAEKLVVAPTPPIEPAGANVLIADMDSTARRVLAARLKERGARVIEASSAEEITAAIRAVPGRFDIAIIGRISRQLSAVEGATTFAPRLAGAETRVLCLVSTDVETAAGRLQKAGVAGCVTTPLRRDQLTAALSGQADQAASEDVGTQSAEQPIEFSPVRILVADDHEVNQLLVVDMLEQSGFRCDSVGDGARAVKASASGTYDVILMDCQMPVMDGYDAARAIRARERAAGPLGKRMHIIALTANVNEGERQRCIEAGMDDYCSKPVQRDCLLRAIREASPLPAIPSAGSPPAAVNPPAATPIAATPGVMVFPGSTDERPSPLPSPGVPGEGERGGARRGAGKGERFQTPAVEESLELETVLRRCSGKPALAERILTKFSAQAGESLEKIDASFAAADAAQVARIAHGLKGSAGMAAATAMHTVAARLEELAKAGDLSVAGDVLASLHAEVIRCREFTDEALKKLSTMDGVAPKAQTKSKEFDDASAHC